MAVKNQNLCLLRQERGVAVVEMLPLLAVFIILFGLTFGFWSSIHRGILQSIAARHYAFEVINNRVHYIYHRDTKDHGGDKKSYYKKNGHRFFAVIQQQPGDDKDLSLIAEKRGLNLFGGDPMSIPKRRESDQVNPIALKTGYGICIDHECGNQ